MWRSEERISAQGTAHTTLTLRPTCLRPGPFPTNPYCFCLVYLIHIEPLHYTCSCVLWLSTFYDSIVKGRLEVVHMVGQRTRKCIIISSGAAASLVACSASFPERFPRSRYIQARCSPAPPTRHHAAARCSIYRGSITLNEERGMRYCEDGLLFHETLLFSLSTCLRSPSYYGHSLHD